MGERKGVRNSMLLVTNYSQLLFLFFLEGAKTRVACVFHNYIARDSRFICSISYMRYSNLLLRTGHEPIFFLVSRIQQQR